MKNLKAEILKKTQESLTANDLGNRLLIEKNIIPFWVVDYETHRIIEVNKAAMEKYGYGREEFLRLTIKDIRTTEETPRESECRENFKNLDGVTIFSTKHRKKNGEIFDVEATYNKVDLNGRTLLIIFATDVTEIRRRSAELVRSQQEKIKILESITDAFISLDKSWRLTFVNGEAERLINLKSEKLLGKFLWEAFPDVKKTIYYEKYKQVLKSGKAEIFESFYLPMNSWFETRVFPMDVGLAIYFRNITERKNYEEKIHRQSELLEQIHDAIFIWELNGNIIYWNKNAERLYGFTSKEATGQSPQKLLQTVFPDNFASFSESLKENIKWEGEIIHTAKNGQEIIVECRLRLFENLEGNLMIMQTCHDVTERKRINEELIRAAKLSLVGELTAGLAHEIKNPLAGIKGALDILIKRRKSDDPEREIMKNMTHQIERIDQTLQALLSRTHIRPLKLESVSLTETINRALVFAQHQSSIINKKNRKTTLKFDLPDEETIVPHDAGLIEDAVLNLVLNAQEAIGDNPGEIKVSLSENETKYGREFLIKVADNGRGISENEQKLIFTPFYTTTANGAGLGLSAVKRIARAHHGDCEFFSKFGQGATFIIRFPVESNEKSAVSRLFQ